MPRNVREFRIVIASPADVFDAREIVFDVIRDLNRSFEGQDISIKAIGWEDYATPGIGDEPQAVVSKQILTDYDILIAIFATKLGTPTSTGRSGTVEEVEHAIQNTSSPFGSNRLQVYFRDKIDGLSQIPITDLVAVTEFRESLSARGILYGIFKTDEEFTREIRINIERQILKFIRDERGASTSPNSNKQKIETPDVQAKIGPVGKNGDDELGFLDYSEKVRDSIEGANVAVNRVAELLTEIGTEATKYTGEIEKISRNASISERKRIINAFADYLKKVAAELQREATTGIVFFDEFADNLIAVATLQRSFSSNEQYKTEVTEFLKSAEGILIAMVVPRINITELMDTVSKLPKITSEFNHGKKALLGALKHCLELIDQSERRIFEISAKL